MTDYLTFSCEKVISGGVAEAEVAWAESLYSTNMDFHDEFHYTDSGNTTLNDYIQNLQTFGVTLEDIEAIDSWPGFELSLYPPPNNSSKTKWSMIIASTEDGYFNAANVVFYVQKFLQKFYPNHSVAFEIAYTASRTVVDAFGGGVLYITANDHKFKSTRDVRHEWDKEHERSEKIRIEKEKNKDENLQSE